MTDFKKEREMCVFTSDGRALIFSTALLAPKTTRSSQGVTVMSLKGKNKVTDAVDADKSGVVNTSRYRVRKLPAAGALLKPEDRGEDQLSLIEES